VFTQKRIEYGKACPELQRTANRRVVFISEPSHNETLNMGIVKEITGGDSMFTRGLFEGGREIQCRFLPILLCNVLPDITDNSDGTWRRLVSMPFPTSFKEHPNPSIQHEKRLDPDLDTKIERWADAFLTHMLTTEYQVHSEGSLVIPLSVQAHTANYMAESDFYREYFTERVTHTSCFTNTLSWTQVWTDFFHWYKRAHGWEYMPKKIEARKRFEGPGLFGKKLYKGEWSGFQLPMHQFSGQ
jgi:phage/plasmid-associated DNA primase